jgi:hypothetical protein
MHFFYKERRTLLKRIRKKYIGWPQEKEAGILDTAFK